MINRPDLSRWRHSHEFVSDFSSAERRTRVVIAITAIMMLAEILAGLAFGSMALLADGWHMSTHVAAFMITAVAYHYSRRHAADRRYTFGAGKVGVLGGFASAVVLGMVAFLMAGESIRRFFEPSFIQFNHAIGVALIGLGVNLVCAWLLKDRPHHPHGHQHTHQGAGEHDHDLNLRAAYVHVLADALTSVTAIAALTAGKYLGWSWLDPVMGMVGSVIVLVWARSLLRNTSGILLDRTPEGIDLPDEIRKAIESDGDAIVTDLHVWQVGPGKFAAIVSLVARDPRPAEAYRALLREHEELVHLTVETHRHEQNQDVPVESA
jgi:cation diffusion facilitator family transporter